MSLRRPVLFAVVGLGMLALLTRQLLEAARRLAAPHEVDLAFTHGEEAAWNGSAHLVVDGRAGHRPRRDLAQPLAVAPLGTPAAALEVVRRTCAQGLVRATELQAAIPGPRVLVLGDDQTMGAVAAEDNWTALLEARLRERDERLATATVLNAACDDYGLVHYVLRGPELVERYAPRVVVVAIATGDDVTALDDRRLPHVDDAMFPEGPAFPPAADPLALGPRALGLVPEHPELARRGLAQAAYRRASPERDALTLRKARQCVLWLRDVAPRGGLLVALVPPADLARPGEVEPLCSAEGRELLASPVQAEGHAAVVTLLEQLGVPFVDLLPALREAPGPDVYRTDGRLGGAGHRLAADALVARVARLIGLR